jgi:hypothetical protein
MSPVFCLVLCSVDLCDPSILPQAVVNCVLCGLSLCKWLLSLFHHCGQRGSYRGEVQLLLFVS